MKKRILALVLTVLMVLPLMVACKKTVSQPASAASPAVENSAKPADAADNSAPAAPATTEPIKIKITTVQLDAQQMGVATNRIKELVDQELKGKVEILPYTGGQLYSNTEELEALKKGDIQMCLAVGSTMNTLDPTIGIFKLPFLFPDVETAYFIMDGPVGEKIFTNIKSQGIDVLGGFSSGAIIVSDSKRPLLKPADLKGLKIRASGKMESAIIEAMGAISTVIPSEETYTGLQQKVVDGLATPSTVFAARKYQEVQKYVTNAGMLYWSNGFILANDKFWQGLPEDIRKPLTEIVAKVLTETRSADESALQKMLDKIQKDGCEVHSLTPEESDLWRQATLPVYDQYSKEIGADLIAEVQKAVSEHKK